MCGKSGPEGLLCISFRAFRQSAPQDCWGRDFEGFLGILQGSPGLKDFWGIRWGRKGQRIFGATPPGGQLRLQEPLRPHIWNAFAESVLGTWEKVLGLMLHMHASPAEGSGLRV